ncbi:MAG: iron-containing alcohol dehydrogenase [Minwuia sp.]|uniref:iron-containing alcohol dehydrogenase n=1 Tax=Minwuia sp. TaxID=2493630 RepID=UPI003A880BA9
MAFITFVNQCHIEHGAIDMLGDTLKQLGISRPLICTDKGLVKIGIVDTIRGRIPNDVAVTIYDGTPENPTETAVKDAVRLFRENDCDGIIALGGGSSMDLSKGAALLLTHDEPLVEYNAATGGAMKIGPTTPMIAIPTTSGTGSEVSRGAVIKTEDGRKLIFSSPNMIAKVSLCDPELTVGLPPLLTAATGMDAVTHLMEAVMSPVENPPAEAIGIDGLWRAVGQGHLLKATENGQDREARKQMMIAASEGALAFTKGLGAVHAMSHAAGRITELNLHHGTLNAVCLPACLRYNDEVLGDKRDRMKHAMGVPAGQTLDKAIEELNAKLGLPANLSEMGITEDMVPGMIEHALVDPTTPTNARPVDAAGFKALYADAMG